MLAISVGVREIAGDDIGKVIRDFPHLSNMVFGCYGSCQRRGVRAPLDILKCSTVQNRFLNNYFGPNHSILIEDEILTLCVGLNSKFGPLVKLQNVKLFTWCKQQNFFFDMPKFSAFHHFFYGDMSARSVTFCNSAHWLFPDLI